MNATSPFTPVGAKLDQPVNLQAVAFILEAVQTSCAMIGSAAADLTIASLENYVNPDASTDLIVIVSFLDLFTDVEFFCCASPDSSEVAVGNTRTECLMEFAAL